MSACLFQNVIVIGYGRVTGEVIRHIDSLRDKYEIALSYIEYEVHDFNQAKKYCEEQKIPYKTIENKADLTQYFSKLDNKTLIVSASNNYLFPANIVDKENLTIINFHNALLPELPGRNAPSWAIFEKKDRTGITWHYVNADVDAGNIIIQKECAIADNEKAYELADRLMHLATEAFAECFENVLLERVKDGKQTVSQNRRIYKSTEVPGNGRFLLTDPPEDIYRLLRSIDYGKMGIFPQAKTNIDGRDVKILRYKVVPKEKAEQRENTVLLKIQENEYLQLKYTIE